jgi:Putative prokaryotic signal transducing protein
MGDKTVVVAHFGDPVEAELAKNRLEAEGIRAFLGTENTAGLFAGMGLTFGGISLHVTEPDLARAAAMLDTPADDEAVPADEDSPAIMARHTLFGSHESALREGPAPELPEPEAVDADDEDDPVGSVAYSAEGLATRAWRAAVLGLLLCPPLLHFYSLYLLLRLG